MLPVSWQRGCDLFLASAMFWLGAPMGDIPRAKLVARASVPAVPPIAVIHPVAAAPAKTWRADGFLAVAGRLRELAMEPVFIGAAADDLSPFRAFRTFFVGNDSGPAHMAAAFGLPVVVVFGDSNPAIWGPWRTASEVVTAPGGIGRVATSQVLDALERLRVHA